MKQQSILFLLAAILWSNITIAQKKDYQVIAIGFYNCENFFDTKNDPKKQDDDFTPNGAYHYTEEVYQQKQHNIATVFQKIGTDITPDGAAIIGMVEVENDKVLSDVSQQPEIKNRNYKHVWFPTSDERGISTAMLYNPKYFQVLHAEPIKVDLNLVGQKRPTRDILHVYGVLAGDTIHVFVNHWPSKSGGEAESAPGRLLAASINKRICDSLLKLNPNTKIMLLGDLNDNPTSEGVIKTLNAKAEKNDVTLTDIYNPWINMYKKGLGTESYRGEWNLIDQIMLSGSLLKNNNNQWKYYKAEIFNKDFLINKLGEDKGLPHRSFTRAQVWDNGYSDHFPVLIYLVKETK